MRSSRVSEPLGEVLWELAMLGLEEENDEDEEAMVSPPMEPRLLMDLEPPELAELAVSALDRGFLRPLGLLLLLVSARVTIFMPAPSYVAAGINNRVEPFLSLMLARCG